jgi:Histidine kinase-, DNA gyrase B-, and HSP90-like ATPase
LTALTEFHQPTLAIVIAHHPLNWLAGFNETQIRQSLHRYADIVLFGHTHHLHDLAHTIGGSGSTVFLPSPATYDRSTSTDSVEYARGYNIVRMDIESRTGAAHYFKYSDAYGSQFTPFVELFPDQTTSSFPINLGKKIPISPAVTGSDLFSLKDVLQAYPNLYNLNALLESRVPYSHFDHHCLEFFEAIIVELARTTLAIEKDFEHVFWEHVILSRALLILNLIQLHGPRSRPFLIQQSISALSESLRAARNTGIALHLAVDDCVALYGSNFDGFSLIQSNLTSIPEIDRRQFTIPWAISQLLLYLDYPELIPNALRSEGRIADVFSRGRPNRFVVVAYRIDPNRSTLTIDLSLQDKDSFLAVTMLKYYFDQLIRHAADFWRQCQQVLNPIGLALEFPRWINKLVNAYELTVETTPIVKLLMGRSMYSDEEHVWFRELVQNALDTNSTREALEGKEYRSRLEIFLHSSGIFSVRDNGIGMSQQHILQYLTRLGKSIWNSEELRENSKITRDSALRAIGKFGIGFAAVFQQAERVVVRTRFFREIDELGWLVEFTSVEKPFLLEEDEFPIGTEIQLELKQDIANSLSPRAFVELVRRFFLYIDDNVVIIPDAQVARTLSDVRLIPDDAGKRSLYHDSTTTEQIGPYKFSLRCAFGFDYRARDRQDKPPASYMLIANSGVRVFEQPSLMLKRGSQYVITEHSSQGQRVEDAREHGIKHFWVAVDFVKGATPILPSRLEVDVDQSFSKELLELIHARFCEAMSEVAQDIATAPTSPKERRRRLLHCLVYSTGGL